MPELPGAVDKPPEQMKPGEVPPGPWDPGLFKDDDGQWYLYWGSSNVFPIYGTEDRVRGRQAHLPDASRQPMLRLHPEEHGWERFGAGPLRLPPPRHSHIDPYVEGAWMTKVGGRYYLQYGAPGTEYQRLRQRRLCRDNAARPVHLCAL